jgi:hypothetical protein
MIRVGNSIGGIEVFGGSKALDWLSVPNRLNVPRDLKNLYRVFRS